MRVSCIQQVAVVKSFAVVGADADGLGGRGYHVDVTFGNSIKQSSLATADFIQYMQVGSLTGSRPTTQGRRRPSNRRLPVVGACVAALDATTRPMASPSCHPTVARP